MTKDVSKPALMHFYDRYNGGADRNDQFLQYSNLPSEKFEMVFKSCISLAQSCHDKYIYFI